MEGADAPVVVGVDGSPEALSAARLGALEAKDRGVPLDLVLALPWRELPPAEDAGDVDLAGVVRSMAGLLLTSTARAVSEGAPGLTVRTRLVEGRATDVLLAESGSAALLCLGSRSGGLLGDLLLGAVAAGVARSARCPVLVVRAGARASVRGRRGVVVGVDGEPGDESVLDAAFDAAARRDTDVVAVHCWQHTVPGPAHLLLDPFVDEDSARAREEAVLDDALAAPAGRRPEVPVRRVVERGRAAPALTAAALAAELLVVGHRPRAGRGLGSVATAVLHTATCPVLVVPIPAGDHAGAGPTVRPAAARS